MHDGEFFPVILVGIGANLAGPSGGPAAMVEAGLAALDGGGVRVVRRSRLWSSPAWPPSDQPPYVNAVALVETALSPADLLARLHAIEAELGRVRGERWAARTLDLDLLAYRDRILRPAAEGGLAIPHPRMADRAFVLLPLADIAPDWRHPETGRSLSDLVAALPPDHQTVPLIP